MTHDFADQSECWPALPLDSWKDTYATLHMWTQIVGKVRLKLDAAGESLVECSAVCDGARADYVADSLWAKGRSSCRFDFIAASVSAGD